MGQVGAVRAYRVSGRIEGAHPGDGANRPYRHNVDVHPDESQAATFRLLYVCTGNVCRSPFAEIVTTDLLRRRLGEDLASRISVTSAGVQAVVGSGMHPDTRK